MTSTGRDPVTSRRRAVTAPSPFPVLAWAGAHAAFGVLATTIGEPVFALGPRTAPVSADLVLVAAGAAALLGLAGRPHQRRWLAAAAGLAAVSGFGVLMDLATLVFDQRVDDPMTATNHVLGMVGVTVLLPWLVADRPERVRAPYPTRHAPESRVRPVAAVGIGALLPYIAVKVTWAVGGTFAGMSGAEVHAVARRNGASDFSLALQRFGVDATVLLAVAGVVLMVALVARWGRRLPRWLVLGPALVGVVTLVPYGTVGILYVAAATAGWVRLPRGDFPTSADALLVSWIGLGAFWVYGVALAVVTWTHLRRGRPPGSRSPS